ncbi:MAG: hypothetical protein BGO33_08735 [Bacteroidia bacterium 43-41]|nr:MAG: hypothetical protein BGO33_08735 [Bacteroidia bacterium 43-41]
MKRKIDQKYLEELTFLKEWNETIINFLILKSKDNSLDIFHQIITETFNKSDLRGMRMIYKDLNEGANDLPLMELNELNQLLSKKFGRNLTEYNNKNLAKIKRIVKKGNISNEEEYRLILNRVEEIYADDTQKDETKILNMLLTNYIKKIDNKNK